MGYAVVFGRIAEFASFSILREGILQILLGILLHLPILNQLEKEENGLELNSWSCGQLK